MKKIIFTLISGLCLFGFSYGTDCSVYDDLIGAIETQINLLKQKVQRSSNGHFTQEQVVQVLGTSKYADEYNSLKKEYDSAVQQKEQCLSNEVSNSSSTTYNNNYQNNTYNKSQNEICKEEFGSYSRAVGNECGCKDGYGWDSSDMNRCVSMEKSCKGRFGENSIVQGNECGCKDGYGWDSPDMNRCVSMEKSCKGRFGENSIVQGNECGCKDGYTMNETYSKCVIATFEQKNSNCSAWNNGNAHYSEEMGICTCNDGYIPNEDETQCVKDTEKQRKLNCRARYGDKATLGDNGENCECSSGYIFDEDGTQCVLDTKEQREKNCKSYSSLSFLGEDGETCECPKGYFADSDNSNYCVIDLDQKSLQSRIMNTKDAKCDDTTVQLACLVEPTKDDCPAVCLELYDAINWMYYNELTIYNDPTKFGIYNPITREQASKFFVNFYKTVFNKTLVTNPQNPFKDINNADPTLYNYILNANALGLFKGSNGKFMPFNHLTKAQAITVIIRMATGLLDEAQKPRYGNYVQRAQSMDLLDNIRYSYNTLDLEDIVRGDVALILYRLYENLRGTDL